MSARGWRRLVRLPARNQDRISEDLRSEFEAHIAMRTEQLMARGVTPDEARQRAQQQFGDVTDATAYCLDVDLKAARQQQRTLWFGDARYDLRHALRQLVHHPVLAVTAIVTLALGIGATTAMYTVVDRLMLHPIPGPYGDRVFNLSRTNLARNSFVNAGRELGDAWREQAHSFDAVALYTWRDATLTDGDEPEETTAGAIDEHVLPLLGATPLLGRAFTASDMVVGAEPVAMLTHGVWRRRFGGDPSALGRTIGIDGKAHTVVGILPREFDVPFMRDRPRQVWIPLVRDSTSLYPQVLGRLRHGVTRAAAVAELDQVMRALGNPAFNRWHAAASRPADYLGRTTQQTLVLLLGAVVVVLMIACVNVANLLLARATARQREFAVRSALGAGRGRLVRQMLTESTILALAGGVAGLGLAHVALRVIVRYRPASLSQLDDVALALPVVGLSLALALITGVVFGLAPAWWASVDMRQASRAVTAGRVARRARATLVVAEVSLSVMLLIGAGLLVRTLLEMQRAPLGFTPDGLVTASVLLPENTFASTEQRWTAYEQLLAGVRSIPGVQDVQWAEGAPSRSGVAFGHLEVSGRGTLGSESALFGYNAIMPGFTSLVGLTLKEGIEPSREGARRNEVMISERFARSMWTDRSPIGERFRLSPEAEWFTVVGLVSDITIPRLGGGPDHNDHMMYAPFDGSRPEATLVMRVSSTPDNLLVALGSRAAAVNPAIRVRSVARLATQIAGDLARPRFNSLLLSVFAGLAAMLTAVGLYGVIAYSVGQRLREMGIRMALGARAAQVRTEVLSAGVGLAALGVVVGLLGAAALTRVMRGMLFGVEPIDPTTYGAVAASIATVALVASWIPARRATRVDPALTLREE